MIPAIKNQTIRLAAVGDLMMNRKPASDEPARGMEALSTGIRELLASCDVVFANLECTLPGEKSVPTEPLVLTTEAQIRALPDAGVTAVTVGNNHTFDCMEEGFRKVTAILDDLAIPWCGAGGNLEEALRPAVMEVHGITLAFLGVVDKSSGMSCFAGESTGGVAPFDTETICHRIRELKKTMHHVIVSPHWGEERFRFPAPAQVEAARAFVDAGASLVLGHHPHVLQGMETYKGAPIAYSLGNFLANSVYWKNGDALTWNRFERTSCILMAELTAEAVTCVRQLPVVDDGTMIDIDMSGWGQRCLDQVNSFLARGVTEERYNRERFRVRTILPILNHLRWSSLRRIRLRHFEKAVRLLLGR